MLGPIARPTTALLIALAPLLGSVDAQAADLKLCVVDAEAALNETTEGKAATQQLETLYAAKQAELERLASSLEKEFQDYESRKAILSDSARQEQERALMGKQAELQQLAMESDQMMQMKYGELLSGMEEKLLDVAAKVGEQKGCSLLLQKAAAVYVSTAVIDVTKDVIQAIDGK